MNRTVHHHAYIRRPSQVIHDELNEDSSGILSRATRSATNGASELAKSLRSVSEFFEVDEQVRLVVGPLRRQRDTGTIEIGWVADEMKRLLPSVNARIEINPIVSAELNPLTELVLHGEYSPPARRQQSVTEFFLERRVVNATLHCFLTTVARELERE